MPNESSLVRALALLRSEKVARVGRVLYCALVAVIFALAAAVRFKLPGLPIAGRDAWGYFHPAISKIAGGEFVHTNGRNFVYPGFVFLVLWAFKSLRAITFVQHLLGLGTGALLLACWQRLRRFTLATPRVLHALLGLCLAATYLRSTRPIQYEHDLRPESITPFFAILNILLTLIFFEQRFGKAPSRRAAITASLLIVNSVLLASLKTSFVLSVLFSVVPVLIALSDRRETWRRRSAVLAVAVLSICAVAVPESLLAKSDLHAKSFLPESLFSIHANLIVRQIDDDVARGDCAPYDCAWLAGFAANLREEMQRSWRLSHTYSSFGFDPDYLFYNPTSMRTWPDRFFGGDREKTLDFCRHYYWRTLRHQPGAMLRKIASQTGIFYAARNPSFSARSTVHFALLYRETAINLSAHAGSGADQEIVDQFIRACEPAAHAKASVGPPLAVRVANYLLSYAYRPVLLGVIACALAAALRPRWRRQLGAALVVLFLFSYNFGNTLGTAVLHSLHILRYKEVQYSFTLLAVVAGIAFLLHVILQFARLLVRPKFAPAPGA